MSKTTVPHAEVFAVAHGHLDRIREYVDVLLEENQRLHTADVDTVGPEVVCLCGSTRFRAEFEATNRRLTLAGCIVVAPGVFGHAEGVVLAEADKVALDRLHLAKIDLADRVFVVNVGGYIGASTTAEIAYATRHGKPVEYLETITADAGDCPESTESTEEITTMTDETPVEYVDYEEAAAVREIRREMDVEAGDDSEIDALIAEDDARAERAFDEGDLATRRERIGACARCGSLSHDASDCETDL